MPRFPAGRRTEFADGTPAIEVPLVAVPIPEKVEPSTVAATTIATTTNATATIVPPREVWCGTFSPWRSVEDPEPEQLTITTPTGTLRRVDPPPVRRDWWDGYLADVQRREDAFYARIEEELGIVRVG